MEGLRGGCKTKQIAKMDDIHKQFEIILPGKWQNMEQSDDILSITSDVAGIDINLSESKNEFLIDSSNKGNIRFSYDGGPLSHDSSISNYQMRIKIINDIQFEFYFEADPQSNLIRYKKIG